MKKDKYKFVKRRILVGGIITAGVLGGISVVNLIDAKEVSNKTNTLSASAIEIPKINENDIAINENIIYKAQKYAMPANELLDIMNGKVKSEKKQVFLTFDDGPSANTTKILEILKKEDVHATFFVLGESLVDEKNQEILKNTINSGNAIGNHTYTHQYGKLYPNKKVDVNAFMQELKQSNDKMGSILGDNFDCRVLRMPAGYMTRQYYKDRNLSELDEVFKNKNLTSIDWNVDSQDAIGKKAKVNIIIENIIKQSADKNTIVILMHDAKDKGITVEALPEIIKYFKENNYEFKVISNSKI